MITIEHDIDETADYALTLSAEGGSPPGYTGAELLTAELWPGDDQPVLAELQAVWRDPPDEITVTISAAVLSAAGVTPALYPCRVRLTAAGRVSTIARFQLCLRPAPAAAAPPRVACSLEDMLTLAPWLNSLQSSPGHQAGFLAQRSLARAWLENQIKARWRGDRDWLEARLRENRLLLTSATRSAAARHAVALVLQSQIGSAATPAAGGGGGGGGGGYIALAERFAREAAAEAAALVAEFDLDDDGRPDLRIDLGRIVCQWSR